MSRKVSIRAFTVLAVGLAAGLSPYASAEPDGLERVAEDKGFVEQGRPAKIQEHAPIPDYAVPGVHDARLATGLAGFAGTLVVFAIGFGAAWTLRRTRGVRRPEPA